MRITFLGVNKPLSPSQSLPLAIKGDSVIVRSYTDLEQAKAAAITYPDDLITYKPEV